MVRNIGVTEKGIRLVLGGILLVGAFVLDLPMWGTIIMGVVGFVALLTGALGYCPARAVFGINTCSQKTNPLKTSEDVSG